jgi:hypothetical protein
LARRRLATGQGDQPRFLRPVQFPRIHAPRRPAIQGGLQARLDELLPDPRDGRLADLHRFGNRGVDPPWAPRAFVRLEQDPRMGQLPRRRRTRGDKSLEFGALGFGQFDDVLLVHAGQDTGCLSFGSHYE